MSVLDRLRLGWETHLGTLVIALVIVLAVLAATYWLLVLRLRRKDLLASKFRAHYEAANELLSTYWKPIGAHKAEFFGRQTIVGQEGQKGLCTVPPPALVDTEILDRFRCFSRAIEGQAVSHRAPLLWHEDQQSFILVEGGLLDAQGRLLPSLKHRLFDKKWSLAAREEVLLELARTLGQIHDCKAELGGDCYHGFVLPRSIYLDIDAENRVNRWVIAHTGIAFAIGPEKLCERLDSLRAGSMPIEKYCAREVLEQAVMLAPEQRDPESFERVGPSADFYAFGALAVTMLTQQKFTDPSDVKWENCPDQWRPFLQACLETIPGRRPKEFMELEDWLSDPELALTHRGDKENSGVDASVGSELETPSTLDVAHLSKRLTSTKNPLKSASFTSSSRQDYLNKARKAIQSSKWNHAKKLLRDLQSKSPELAEVHALLAIACYESGELDDADSHYQTAKRLNPDEAKLFRSHVAARM